MLVDESRSKIQRVICLSINFLVNTHLNDKFAEKNVTQHATEVKLPYTKSALPQVRNGLRL